MVNRVHPLTVFLNAINADYDSEINIYRKELGHVEKFAPDTLKELALIYEKLLRNGILKEWDIDDLNVIEQNLYLKINDLNSMSKKMQSLFKNIKGKTIAEMIIEIQGITNNYKEEISTRINSDFGLNRTVAAFKKIK